jgi:hypothetical protein
VKDKVNNIHKETGEVVNNFNENYIDAIKEVKTLKEDNGAFTTHYKLYEKREEERRQKLKHFDIPFKDLIRKYNDRGYRIPNLSVKNNLFHPSPLLFENKEIREYYKYTTIDDSECKFLEKANTALVDRLNTIDIPPAVRKKSEIHRRLSLRSRPIAIQNMTDLQDEHKKLRIEISKAYDTLYQETLNTEDKDDILDSNVKRHTKKKGSLYKTVEIMNSISSQANSTNYTGMSFSPTNKDLIIKSAKPKQISISQTYIHSKPIKFKRPNQTGINLQYKKPPVSRNQFAPKTARMIGRAKQNYDNCKGDFNQHGFIEYIYNRTKEDAEFDTENLLKTYYKTFYNCGEEEIKTLFNSK